jgi:2-methylcitrate dehydratase PrpD
VIPHDAIEALLPAKTLLRIEAISIYGQRHAIEVANPLGHPDNPMQDSHIDEKFTSLAEPALGKARCRAALEDWWDVVRAEDVGVLIRLLDVRPAA